MKIIIMALLIGLCSIGTATHAADEEALKEMTAMVLNLNGLLCAKVVDIKPLQVRPNVYEVTCIEYRGGSGTKTYIMDASKGTAWVP